MYKVFATVRVARKGTSGLASSNQRNGQYRTFPDKPEEDSGGFSYEGDGREQVEFFRQYSNYNELIESMSYEDQLAFQRWCEGKFMRGQQWRGFDSMTRREQELTRVYDKYLDESVLKAGVTVTRLGSAELLLGSGNSLASSIEQLRALEGRDIFAKGSMSFGAASQGLSIGSYKNVEYKLRIPGGTKGAGMWIGDDRINAWGEAQREFLTNRDVWYKVGKTTYDSDRNVYVVELQYNTREKHDYGRRGR